MSIPALDKEEPEMQSGGKLGLEISAFKEELGQKLTDHDGSCRSRAEKIARLLDQAQKLYGFLIQCQPSTQAENNVLVAIDGNSCVFQESLLWDGLLGGATAAENLLHAV
ncbi:hypothetical protein MMC07_000613 [Pseudocyphellaria aurata]|nr:hypothetical protein [Pseudocyphellaria aurata]